MLNVQIDLDLTTGIYIKMIIDEQDHKFTINEMKQKFREIFFKQLRREKHLISR